jgi:hypothetical protein
VCGGIFQPVSDAFVGRDSVQGSNRCFKMYNRLEVYFAQALKHKLITTNIAKTTMREKSSLRNKNI